MSLCLHILIHSRMRPKTSQKYSFVVKVSVFQVLLNLKIKIMKSKKVETQTIIWMKYEMHFETFRGISSLPPLVASRIALNNGESL